MSDEDGPKNIAEKPMDWLMDEDPSTSTLTPRDEEPQLLDQSSQLLKSVISPRNEEQPAGKFSMFVIKVPQ